MQIDTWKVVLLPQCRPDLPCLTPSLFIAIGRAHGLPVPGILQTGRGSRTEQRGVHHGERLRDRVCRARCTKKKRSKAVIARYFLLRRNAQAQINCHLLTSICPKLNTSFVFFGIGINDERLSGSSSVICSISAQANALVLPLKIVQESFGIRFCSYTFLKAVMGPTKEIKCPTLGPATHRKMVKWDFSENLVSSPCPALDEEAIRFMPSM